jgi:predicted MFS family arabinose efflux permease
VILGLALLAGLFALDRRIERNGGTPLVASALIADRRFRRGLGATFCFYCGNLSFYLTVALFVQGGLGRSPWQAGLAMLPLAIAFIVGSRHSIARSSKRGVGPLIEGSGLQIAGLGILALGVLLARPPSLLLVAALLSVFGYGQGLVMAPLASRVLSRVQGGNASSGSGVFATTTQIANATGVAVIGAVFFTAKDRLSDDGAAFLACRWNDRRRSYTFRVHAQR